MKQKSDKQKKIDRIIAKSKHQLIRDNDNICMICGKYSTVQLAHLLPKSIYPEYYTLHENHALFCQECHYLYDNDIQFRQNQENFYKQICSFDKMAADKYFKLN